MPLSVCQQFNQANPVLNIFYTIHNSSVHCDSATMYLAHLGSVKCYPGSSYFTILHDRAAWQLAVALPISQRELKTKHVIKPCAQCMIDLDIVTVYIAENSFLIRGAGIEALHNPASAPTHVWNFPVGPQ